MQSSPFSQPISPLLSNQTLNFTKSKHQEAKKKFKPFHPSEDSWKQSIKLESLEQAKNNQKLEPPGLKFRMESMVGDWPKDQHIIQQRTHKKKKPTKPGNYLDLSQLKSRSENCDFGSICWSKKNPCLYFFPISFFIRRKRRKLKGVAVYYVWCLIIVVLLPEWRRRRSMCTCSIVIWFWRRYFLQWPQTHVKDPRKTELRPIQLRLRGYYPSPSLHFNRRKTQLTLCQTHCLQLSPTEKEKK